MKIEILVSEEIHTVWFSFLVIYCSEILGPNYDSCRCYEQKSGSFPQKCDYDVKCRKFTESSMGQQYNLRLV